MDYSKLTKEELISIIHNLQNDEIDKTRDLFLSNISHDVRTLLNAIYGNAQILNNDDSLNENQKKSLQRIIEASSHMIDLINNIISISKNSGNDKVVLSEFNLKDLLNSTFSVFKSVANSKNLSFELLTNIDDSFIIKTDKNKLFYILLNLLGNAFKYTNSGMVLFSCKMKDNKVNFEIKDTGLGIEEDKIDKLTNQYERGENSKGTQGFGLGLGIVSKNLSLLGSILDIKSKVNKGSTFGFKIKCQKNKKTFVSTQDDIFEMKEIESIKNPNNFNVLIYAKTDEEIPILSSYFNSRKILYSTIDNIDDLKKELELKQVKMLFIDLTSLNNEDVKFFMKLKSSTSNLSIVSLTSSVMSDDLIKVNELSTTYIVEPYSFVDIDQALIMFSNEEFNFVQKTIELEKHEIVINNDLKEDIINEAKLGNYKKCCDTINLIEDSYSKKVLLNYLDNYDFDKIVDTLEHINE